MLISPVKLGILTQGSMGIDLFLSPASSGHLRSCFWLFRYGFMSQHERYKVAFPIVFQNVTK